MELYIPKHIKDITIFKQLCSMIEEYSKRRDDGSFIYYEDPTDSFDDFRTYERIDPVKHFITFCIEEESFIENHPDELYDDVVNYISRLFYSVKGTMKVFDYMQDLLGIKFTSDPIYTVRRLEINLGELSINDENLYYDALKGFLDALLFFEELDVNIAKITIELDEKLTRYLQGSTIEYRNFEVDQYKELQWESSELDIILEPSEDILVEDIQWSESSIELNM